MMENFTFIPFSIGSRVCIGRKHVTAVFSPPCSVAFVARFSPPTFLTFYTRALCGWGCFATLYKLIQYDEDPDRPDSLPRKILCQEYRMQNSAEATTAWKLDRTKGAEYSVFFSP
ncbi:hypothetical protein BO82DRAFT_133313 [Aspergillus uvarum CBS 121591]|uniref:Cytochrome P450 n=1 Tax=Aspergillus uvarum CBS 121591 TaxID=1448315 RepID=A0A319C691_9EURO|nr:hypothetical protein BO82DRAFT_133313 [Aspergillus uvarum CBS 121591]PYH79447.1 hypothetical protein BO82DRAFT_133313 [Aspergillus uvarum CBS 121591]